MRTASPRLALKRELAEGLGLPNPNKASWSDVNRAIDAIPDEDPWDAKAALKARIADELDGARPFA